MTFDELNTAPPEKANAALLLCCGSRQWTKRMIERRPFGSPDGLFKEAEAIWFSLTPSDWLEAFGAHPKIGQNSSSKWSNEEQRGIADGDVNTMGAVRDLNIRYEDRFGYIFIVCATGKSAGDMRALLEQRLPNEPAAELQNAANEQAKIMRLRLGKLLAE